LSTLLDRFRVDGKVAIVTGASSGLGVAFAEGLAEAGADVVICARRVDRLEQVRDRILAQGHRCIAIPTDVGVVDDCTRVVEAARAEFGRVDILVNNAGVGGGAPATVETPQHFRHILDINLNGTYWMSQACGRVMVPGSAIVNISSILGYTTIGLPLAAYSSSKAAVIGLTRDLAQQWTGRKGIRVNALVPGLFRSEMSELYPDGHVETLMARIPAARLGDPRELVCALIFLASDAASYMSGAVVAVDGGLMVC
jgi:NAD(P)-dependent dehydrogenase (short-subunit alcohol dehydrogenase family)